MTYADLRAAIQEYTENYEPLFASRVDTFIRQAENRIPQIVRLPPTRKQVQGVLTLGDQYLSPPSDFLSCDSLFVIDEDNMHSLENKDPEFIRVCYPSVLTFGRPRYYAKVDDKTLLIGPTPDLAYPTQMAYFALPQSITVAPTGRTYMGDNCESLLLYQSLVEAYTFMKGDPEMLTLYRQRAQEAAELFTRFGEGKARKDSFEEPDARMVEAR